MIGRAYSSEELANSSLLVGSYGNANSLQDFWLGRLREAAEKEIWPAYSLRLGSTPSGVALDGMYLECPVGKVRLRKQLVLSQGKWVGRVLCERVDIVDAAFPYEFTPIHEFPMSGDYYGLSCDSLPEHAITGQGPMADDKFREIGGIIVMALIQSRVAETSTT